MLRLFSVFCVLLFGANAYAAQMTEKEKIDTLLDNLGKSNVVFVSNGKDHDAAWGKKHLEDKLKATKPQVKTADDFIKKVATKSTHSGKPYMIKTPDGKEVASAEWMNAQLAAIVQPSAGKTEKAATDMKEGAKEKEETKKEDTKQETAK